MGFTEGCWWCRVLRFEVVFSQVGEKSMKVGSDRDDPSGAVLPRINGGPRSIHHRVVRKPRGSEAEWMCGVTYEWMRA